MKNIVLAAAALALLAGPALAVGPESFTVDVGNGYRATSPQQEQAARSNWAPRGQAQQASAPAEEANQASTRRPGATKASGKPAHRAHRAAKSAAPAHAPAAAPAEHK
ncbi:MAG: hypothetical protein EB059_08715 [Alphaproteobacteria bacterium]|nr:hypothetical protein [Alphaproteobacteria bacterium]